MARLIDADELGDFAFHIEQPDGHERCVVDWDDIETAPTVDAKHLVHGQWVLEARNERVNCRWNVTAECSECRNEKKKIWAGFFPGISDALAKNLSLDSAESVKLPNFCDNCGANMLPEPTDEEKEEITVEVYDILTKMDGGDESV